jgi:hypothetical protein
MKDTITSIGEVLTDKTSMANYGALAVVNFTNLEMGLKVAVGITTIIWTILRINDEIQKIKDRKAKDNSDISNKD